MKTSLFNWLLALLFVGGLSLAGSDGPLFPWPNLAGLGLFLAFFALVKLYAEGKGA
ncbi:hypothetical protein [Geoalkalibacter halelectricus]|uniref:hypothetical protein n=1 Tax=Geoalkalibacter halelectricus TaxID=2847045 RepID=UPI003D1AFD01